MIILHPGLERYQLLYLSSLIKPVIPTGVYRCYRSYRLWCISRWPLVRRSPASRATVCKQRFQKLYPIVLAAHVWGHHRQGHRVQFSCDNRGVSDARAGRSGVSCVACSSWPLVTPFGYPLPLFLGALTPSLMLSFAGAEVPYVGP